MSIGTRLKEYVDSNFKSTADFARHFGKGRSSFHPYFTGSSIPGGEILQKLAESGCDINWLLTGEVTETTGEQKIGSRFVSKKFRPEIKETESIFSHYEKIIQQQEKLIEQLYKMLEDRNTQKQ